MPRLYSSFRSLPTRSSRREYSHHSTEYGVFQMYVRMSRPSRSLPRSRACRSLRPSFGARRTTTTLRGSFVRFAEPSKLRERRRTARDTRMPTRTVLDFPRHMKNWLLPGSRRRRSQAATDADCGTFRTRFTRHER